MAKVAFSKLDLKVNNTENSITHVNNKGEEIIYEVKNYLPIKEKMELVSRIINQSTDDNGFYNPMRVKLFTVLEIVYAYTNLTFTAKQKEDVFKLYDMIISSGLYDTIRSNISEKELKEIKKSVYETITNIYAYRNSVMGILDNVVTDYSTLDFNASEIQKKLADPENLELLRQVLTKLG